MKRLHVLILSALALVGVGLGAAALILSIVYPTSNTSGPPSKANAQNYTTWLVDQALALYESEGLDAAIAHYGSPESLDGSWYVFIIGADGSVIGHYNPDYLGEPLTGPIGIDATGYEFGKAMAGADESGRWVSYVFLNPETNEEQRKHAWVVRRDGILFGSGWYDFSSFGASGATTDREDEPQEFSYSFANDPEGWVVGFADLPQDYDQSIYELSHSHSPLPDGLEGSGIYVQSHNRSDDLFMFVKRQVGGLRADATYKVVASVDLATNVAGNLIGIGGSPGGSVYVKAGASPVEPDVTLDSNQYLRMNIDKGNQSGGGESAVVLGDVAHPGVAGDEYRIKTLDNANRPLTVQTDSEGKLWLMVGADSGFEGFTALYFASISFTLTPEP